jgi:hypothetical protein
MWAAPLRQVATDAAGDALAAAVAKDGVEPIFQRVAEVRRPPPRDMALRRGWWRRRHDTLATGHIWPDMTRVHRGWWRRRHGTLRPGP